MQLDKFTKSPSRRLEHVCKIEQLQPAAQGARTQDRGWEGVSGNDLPVPSSLFPQPRGSAATRTH